MIDSDDTFINDLSIAEKEQDLPKEVKEKRKKGQLRTGLTTGTSAAAATKAALQTLLGKEIYEEIQITLPKGKIVELPIAWTRVDDSRVTCSVIKDGGDDPDVTHGAEILSTVEFTSEAGSVQVKGGIGVGKVTKPGLGLPIGSHAINPVPLKMIKDSVDEVLSKNIDSTKSFGIAITITVPKGAEIAIKTDNPRLGIIGGISILGTTGIVLPYSTASFAAAIRQGLDVGIAQGADTFILTTGGRSEDFMKHLFQERYPEHCYIQMGDFAGFSVKQCHDKGVKRIFIGGFIGKLTKIAMGVKQTHVRGSHVSMDFMARLAEESGANKELVDSIVNANTARHVSEIIDSNSIVGFYDLICREAVKQLKNYSGNQLLIEVLLFDFNGNVVGRYPK
ncbi:MAG: cobalt-precorrin-5B (C(1))-methyltransferase [Candidatus Nitrosocosmicus sp.]|uniref:cobalt-precorrin-5B (C(1))-methyltransferase n=1 Tax=Candidatus Nitrosocosmicus sp. FF01 TaxID=3397670 RepID=UPI0039EAC80D